MHVLQFLPQLVLAENVEIVKARARSAATRIASHEWQAQLAIAASTFFLSQIAGHALGRLEA